MNPKAKKFQVHTCEVCGYRYSDAHHIYPASKEGKRTIYLCPNHHRYANMVQIILENNRNNGEESVRKFAADNFDPEFNLEVLTKLIDSFYILAYQINGEFKSEHDKRLKRTVSPNRRQYVGVIELSHLKQKSD